MFAKIFKNLLAKFKVQKFLIILYECQYYKFKNHMVLMFNNCFVSVLISLKVITYENLFSRILSKQTGRESFCPRNIRNLVIHESLYPRNTEISGYWLNRESFFPRKFLPLKYKIWKFCGIALTVKFTIIF